MHYRYCPVCGNRLKDWNEQLMICNSCGYHFYQTSKPTAGAVIVKEDKSSKRYMVLLTRRGIEPYKGYWDIPGGFLQNGEQPEDGLRREIREELGIEIYEPRLYFAVVDRYPREDIPQEASYTLCLYHLCRIDETLPLKAEDDITESRWFFLDELPSNLSFEGNKKALLEAKAYLEKITN